MILQSLYDYYQRKAANTDSNIAPQGFEWKEIPFLIVINKDGKFINLEPTSESEGNNKKAKRAKSFLVPKSKGKSGSDAWKTTNVFWDHYGYVLENPKDDPKKNKIQNKEDAKKQHSSFIKLVNEIVEKFPSNEQFIAVKNFLQKEDQIQKVFNHQNWKDCIKILGCNLSFRLIGETNIVAEHADLKTIAVSNDFDDNKGVCLITGDREPIVTLNTATSIPGGKSGAKLVSFQKSSGYDSYYKEQGGNAPISKKAEDAYTTALKDLLGKDSRNKFRISDTTVVFWAEKEINFEKQFSFFFTNPNKDDPGRNAQEVKALYESIHSGKFNSEGSTQFYILGLAPNVARILVRFWETGTVNDFGKKIAQHFTDLELAEGKQEKHKYFTLFSLLTNIVLDYKMDNVPPNLASAVIESILKGTPYPATLQQQCIRRIRAEQKVNHIRAAILKAYLNRKNRITNYNKEKEITMALDKENKNQGYLCGRLFAILEKIQQEAQPGITTTIKDRFYGAASSTPVTVFGRLLNLTNHHLAKLHPGRKTNLDKLLQEIMDSISSNGMPAHLSLDDQSRFAIGYYQQRQDFFISK